MTDRNLKNTFWAIALLGSFCSSATLHAQSTSGEASSEDASEESPQQSSAEAESTTGFATMTVTADQREMDAQDAPLSLSALPEEELMEANITKPENLNNYVPGLQVNKSSGGERLISIRGVGSQTPQNFFTQPGVSFHMDGAYLTNTMAISMGFLDVERIEVQRGPQGTVFGAASTGGTMNVVSKKPELGYFGGEISAGFGNHSYARGFGAVNVPLGDTAAIRAALQTETRDGYTESTSIPGGHEMDDADNINGRISALWRPLENLSVQLISQSYRDTSNGSAYKSWDDPEPDPRKVSQDYPGLYDMDMDLQIGIVTWQLPWATFKSTSSYQDMTAAQSFDNDRSDFENFGGYDHVAAWDTYAESFSQEFTLSSVQGGLFDWVAGVFFLESSSGQYVLEYAGDDPNDPTPRLPPDLDASETPDNVTYANTSDVDRTSWAPFLQGTLNFSDRFRLTAGVRYNDDDYDGFSASYFAEPSPRAFGSSTTTGKVAVEFDVAPENLLYASWSRGYKPGGINAGAEDAMETPSEYEPEIVDAFELGSKNRFLGNTVSLNAAAFYYQYEDMQFIQEDPIPFAGGIGNIPSANIWGLEMEGGWMLFDYRLRLGMNATLMDGEYPDEFEALDRRLADAAGDQAIADGTAPFEWSPEWFEARGSAATQLKGKTPPNLPELAGGVNATWYQDLADHGTLTSRVEYQYRGEYEARVFNTPVVDDVDSYWQMNLFLEYKPSMKPWRVWLTVTNLTDEDGVGARFVDPYGSGVVSNAFIPPRQLVANFGYTF